MLSDRFLSCPVCNVGVLCHLWPNGWTAEYETWQGGRPPPGHVVLDSDSPLQRGTTPNFRPMSIVAKRSPISATAEHLRFILFQQRLTDDSRCWVQHPNSIWLDWYIQSCSTWKYRTCDYEYFTTNGRYTLPVFTVVCRPTALKCVRVIKIFMSLAKYCYNTTYLFTWKAHHKFHNPVIFRMLINNTNTIIVMKSRILRIPFLSDVPLKAIPSKRR